MMAFMFTTCPHCQALSKVITKLQGELGPKGFQALGATFNDEVNTPNLAVNAQVTASFVSQFQVGFPVGYAPRNSVLSYLGVSEIESWVVPQIAIIDRKGVIRAQSASRGTADLQTESYLRKYLGELLSEGAAKTATPAKIHQEGCQQEDQLAKRASSKWLSRASRTSSTRRSSERQVSLRSSIR